MRPKRLFAPFQLTVSVFTNSSSPNPTLVFKHVYVGKEFSPEFRRDIDFEGVGIEALLSVVHSRVCSALAAATSYTSGGCVISDSIGKPLSTGFI